MLPAYKYSFWLDHNRQLAPSYSPTHDPSPQEQEPLAVDEYESVKVWKPLTPDEPLSTPSHRSSVQTPLQPDVSSSHSFSIRAVTEVFDQDYPQHEHLCYQPTASNYSYVPYQQMLYPLNPFAQNPPHKFEKPMTPSTTPSENQSATAAPKNMGQVMGESKLYSQQGNTNAVDRNGYHTDGFAQDVMPLRVTSSPTSFQGNEIHRVDCSHGQVLGTGTILPTALNGNNYYMGSTDQPMQSRTGIDSLINYLFQHVDNPEFADCQLEICVEDEVAHVKVHALIVGQSPFLRAMVTSASYAEDTGMKHLGFRTPGEYGKAAAFVAALRVLYGADPYESFCYLCNHPDIDSSSPLEITMLDVAIAYLFAANVLEIPQIQAIGVDTVSQYLSLDRLEKTIAFALSGDPEIVTLSMVSPVDSDGGVIPNGAFQRAHTTTQIIGLVIQFMVYNFPQNFVLDTTVSSTMELGAAIDHPGSPPTQATHKATSRLSSIRFGDMPIEDEPIPSKESTIFSKILLSLPEQYVNAVFDQLEGWLPRQARSSVTDERKKRFEVGPTRTESDGQVYD